MRKPLACEGVGWVDGSPSEASYSLAGGAQSDEFLADGPDRRLRAVGDADFPQDVLDVLLDRLVTDVQRLGDLLVGQPIGQLPEDLALALGQRHLDIGGQPRRGQGSGDASQFVAGPGTFAGSRRADRLEQFLARP